MLKTRPWQAQPGLEAMMLLPAAIFRAEMAAVERGEEIANGRHPGHQQAFAVLGNALDAVNENWERCKLEAYGHATFGQSYLVAFHTRLTRWCGDLAEAAMRWVDWPHYVASGMPDRTRDLVAETQEFEKRLYELRPTGTGDGPAEQAERQDPGVLAKTYTVAALREMTGLENTALNRYAKAAKVKTPRRGGRDFRYTAAGVRAILETIIAKTSENALRAKCQVALRNLREIAE